MEYMFRNLKANEIDVRVSTCNEKGVSLLLYKDARVDQDILDETVGPMNWQRKHTRDNANCIVEIWDNEKSQWISKEDTGTESFSQAEKGLASDSFKRACVNWGIGRELYTSPLIKIWLTKDEDYYVKNDKAIPTLSLDVATINYDEATSVRSCWVEPNLDTTHGLRPIRLLCPWHFPGEDTGVGCHFLLRRDLPDPGIKPQSPAHGCLAI